MERCPWVKVCDRSPTWVDHPAQAALCAAHARRSYASKGSLDTVLEAVPRLSLMVLLISRCEARSRALCRTNPWCLAVVRVLCWHACVRTRHAV